VPLATIVPEADTVLICHVIEAEDASLFVSLNTMDEVVELRKAVVGVAVFNTSFIVMILE
jgi:hypothetical protein